MSDHDIPSTAAPPTHGRATVRTYLAIGAVLAVLTVIEVQLPRLMAHGPLLVVSLVLTALFKASLVAAFYMHLKYDSRAYLGVMALAIFLIAYFLVLLTFGQFTTPHARFRSPVHAPPGWRSASVPSIASAASAPIRIAPCMLG